MLAKALGENAWRDDLRQAHKGRDMSRSRREAGKLLLGSALSSVVPAFAKGTPDVRLPRFSVMLWTLQPQATFDQSLEIVAAAGYKGVELVGEFHHWDAAETRRILTRLGTLGLTVDAMSGVSAGFAVPAQSDAFLTQFRAHLQSARQLRCPQVILLSGPIVPGLDPAAQRQAALENLRKAADLAAAAEINIVIEPIDPLEQPTVFLQSVAQAFPLVREANRPNLRVLFDLYHEQRSFGNLLEKLEANLDLIGLIHIADVPGRHEPGTGEINFTATYQNLAELRYNRWLAMEFYPTVDPVTTLRSARQQVEAAYTRSA